MPRHPKVVVTCQACGKTFSKHYCNITQYNFCSRKCISVDCIPTTCAQCGKEFLTNGRSYTEAKFCSTECRNARDRKEQVHKKNPKITRICQQCGKQFEVRKSVGKNALYCSKACFHASGKFATGFGSDNPKWKPKITVVCAYCGKEIETYPSRDGRKKYCCQSHRMLGMLKRIAAGGRTDIELAMAAALRKSHIAFSEQVVMFDKFMVDFKLTNYPIIVQCDGAYWHDKPKAKAKDKGQDAYLVKAGYVVLRFTDRQVLHQMPSCIKTIKQAINSPNQPRLIQG